MGLSEPLAILLGRLGAEVEAVADCVGSIDAGAGVPSAAEVGLTDAHLVDLQKLDLVEQTLRSLAAVLGEIALAEVGAERVDVRGFTEGLPLAALAARLQGGAVLAEPSGGLELF